MIIIISFILSIGAISAKDINGIEDKDINVLSEDNNINLKTDDNKISQSFNDNENINDNLIEDNNVKVSNDSQNLNMADDDLVSDFDKDLNDKGQNQNPTLNIGQNSSLNQNTLNSGEIKSVVVNNWDELKSYAESTTPIIITLKDNTQFIPTSGISIKSNVTIIGSKTSFIGGNMTNPLNLTNDLISLKGGDISINLINLRFEYMKNRFIAIISSNYLNTIENCSFVSNYNGNRPSSIVQLEYGALNMKNTRFINNTATYGTVSNYNSQSVENVHMNVTNCIFEDNRSLYIVGGINNCGYLNVVNSSFSRNNASKDGWGGAIHSHSSATTIIYDSNFTDNFAGWQGGAICNYANLEVYNSNFIGNNNTGTYGGAAIFSINYQSSPIVYILNCTFAHNNELTNGAAGGAIMHMDDGNFTCINSTFISNNASRGQAIIATRASGYVPPNIIIVGNKFINHTGSGETLIVDTARTKFVCIVENNTYENTRVLFNSFNITVPGTIYNVNSTIRFAYSVELNNASYYDEDILRKLDFDIYVNGVKTGTVSSLSSYFYLNFSKKGTYTVNVVSPQFYGSSNNITLQIVKGEIQFIDPVSIVNYGDILNVSLKVFDTINETYFTSGDIRLIIMDNRSDILFNQNYSLEGEKLDVNIPIYSRFDFKLIVSFYREDYGDINSTLYIQMNPESVPDNITINAKNLTVYYTNTSYLTFYVYNYTDPVSFAEVVFKIASTYYNETTDANGCIKVQLPKLNIGSYDVTLKYGEFEKNITINVKPIPFKFTSVTTKLIKDQYFKACLKDLNGKALAKRSVTITIGSTKYTRVTDSKGMISVLVNLNPKKYNVKLSHDFYTARSKLTVTKIPIKFTSITKTVKRGGYFKLRVIDTYKKAVKSKVIVVKIKSKTYKVKTDSKGYIKIKISLKPGRYRVNYKLAPDKIYGSGKTFGAVTITVKK